MDSVRLEAPDDAGRHSSSPKFTRRRGGVSHPQAPPTRPGARLHPRDLVPGNYVAIMPVRQAGEAAKASPG
jgi:hypothetical protein